MGICHLHHTMPIIVHADVKPENIFVDSTLGCKVGDLGGSVLLQETQTHHKAAISILYASPKRMRRVHAIKYQKAPAHKDTQASWLSLADDAYSFGVTIFDALVRGEQNELFDEFEDRELMEGVKNGTCTIESQLPGKSIDDRKFLRRSFPEVNPVVLDHVRLDDCKLL
jgi:serine/threonine protein kinase